MYSRVGLSRAVSLVVALLLTVASAEAVAREFRAADTRSEDYPTVQALRYMDRMIVEKSGGRHQIRLFRSRRPGEEKKTIEQTRAGGLGAEPVELPYGQVLSGLATKLIDGAENNWPSFATTAAAELIERIRKVE